MAKNLDDARRSLVRAQQSAKKRLEQLEQERREIKASLKSLAAALKALGAPSESQPIIRPAVDDDELEGAAPLDLS